MTTKHWYAVAILGGMAVGFFCAKNWRGTLASGPNTFDKIYANGVSIAS